MDIANINLLAQAIVMEAESLTRILQGDEEPGYPSRTVLDDENELWSHPSPKSDLGKSQTNLLALLDQMSKCVRGPREFLCNLVASNWDQGALYCLLEHKVLEYIPVGMQVPATRLANQTGIPREKLLPMLRLAVCEDILEESSPGVFQHGLISRELLKDPRFKAFIQFQ